MQRHTHIDQYGRILMLSSVKKESQLNSGDRRVIDYTQKLFKELTKPNIADVDQFIADKQKEFKLEESKFKL